MSVRVALAGPEDAAAVAAVMAEFRDWHGRTEPTDDSLREGVERLVADPGTEFLLGSPEPGAAALGVCQLRFRYGIWYTAEDCWLEDLYVRADARGSGVGGALVEAAVERARRRGCRRIDLDASSDNRPALALYERLGFSADAGGGALTLLLRRTLASGS